MPKSLKHKPEDRQEQIARLIRVYGLGRAGHAHFSPSSSAGWLNCKGFLLANAGKPDVAGEAAAYGTVAHGVAASWLTVIRDHGRKYAERILPKVLNTTEVQDGFTITIDANMIHHIRRYIDWCAEVELTGDVFIEQRLDYSEYMPIPQQGGTCDHFVCSPGVLTITDLKMGMLPVLVEGNSQAMCYALAAYLEWNWFYSFKKIIIRIAQPRLDYFEKFECTVEELLAFGETIRVAADAAWTPDAPRTPGLKQCQWCGDRECPARSKLIEDMADDTFDSDGTPEYTAEVLDHHLQEPMLTPKPTIKFDPKMTTRLMAWRLQQKPLIDKAFAEWEAELYKRASAGERIPGFKKGLGNRSFSWHDPDYAVQQLAEMGVPEDKIFVTEVTSVSAAKALLQSVGRKPKEIEGLLFTSPEDDPDVLPLVRTTPGKPKLVKDTSDREDVQDVADDVFADD